MILLNFGHPITEAQRADIERLTEQAVGRVVEVRTHFDPECPFMEQARALVDAAALSAEEWQSTPLLVNLPALSVIAALTLAEMHGRCGYFPAVLRLRPAEGVLPPRFEVAEILDLQQVRASSRSRRAR